MYVCLPPCLRCSNSCVCFSLLPPPSLDYHCERKHAAHRALQSSGGGRAKVNPMWGQGLAATTITTWLWGAGGPQGGGDRAGATVAAFGWSADAPTVVSRGGGLSVLLLSSVFSPEHLHSNEEIWAFSCFSARSCHVFPLSKRGLVVVYCNFPPPPSPFPLLLVQCNLLPAATSKLHRAPSTPLGSSIPSLRMGVPRVGDTGGALQSGGCCASGQGCCHNPHPGDTSLPCAHWPSARLHRALVWLPNPPQLGYLQR